MIIALIGLGLLYLSMFWFVCAMLAWLKKGLK
jgi:hypothetical protein